MTITLLDIGILILFLYFIIGGYKKGFIEQTSTIFGIILALIISMNYYDEFVPIITPYINVGVEMLQFISFAILFIAINVFVHILGVIFKKILDMLFLKPLDHAAGAALGLVKGFVLSYFLVLMLYYIPYSSLTEQINNSILAVKLLDMTPVLQNSIHNIFNN